MSGPFSTARFSAGFALVLGLMPGPWAPGSLRVVAATAPPLPADHAERFTRGLEQFQRDIRPLLITHCLKCHGGEKVEGDFSLVTREDLLKGGAEGPAVRLFDGPGSRLVRLVSRAEKPHMPAKADPLPEASVRALSDWIHNGAPYDGPLIASNSGGTAGTTPGGSPSPSDSKKPQPFTGWPFRPLTSVTPPAGPQASPHPIDAFVGARLAATNLTINPEADRRTLLRRASFDLTGLPPAPEDLQALEHDAAPGAWERAIDRLLARPEHGERWARHWLDVARFAESSGFEHDYDRPGAHHYRDFVIRALNADMPYDQFVQWQLAGDEFEPDNPLALMATGFLGAGVFPTQITANEVERTRYDAMDDMLSTTTSAMLGLTVGCARCHDHKFDPIPTRDYYRLLSTFTTTVRSQRQLDLDPEQTRRKQAAFESEHARHLAEQTRYEQTTLPGRFEAWLQAGATVRTPADWELLESPQWKSQAGASFRGMPDGSFLAEGKNADHDTYTFTGQTSNATLRSLRLEALPDPSLPQGGPGRADNGNLGLSRIRVFAQPLSGGERQEVRLVRPRATFQQNAGNLSLAGSLDNDPHTGWAVDPKFGTRHAAILDFESPIQMPGGVRLTVELEFRVNARHHIGRPRLSVTSMTAAPFDSEGVPAGVASLLERIHNPAHGAASLSAAERSTLKDWWKVSDEGWRQVHARVEDHAKTRPKPALTPVLTCGEGFPAVRMHTQGGDFLPETHFLHRGSTEQKRGVAAQGFLRVLLKTPDAESRWHWQPPTGAPYSGRRRSLALWMTDPAEGAGHLLARVIVNRLWQHHFGQGLVATPNDFGAQGTPPSHPELLDWLAGELIRGGWRLKPLHRLMMTSQTYRQSSARSEAQRQRDPNNTLLSRHVPHRLEAESIRDTLLWITGALDATPFGPGTLDESTRRRSIYFTVKRSQLIPAMQVFDAPEPLVSQGTRPATTVAPQALWLMNNPQVRHWAGLWAKRVTEGAADPAHWVPRAYQQALQRPPTAAEAQTSLEFLSRQTARYRASGTPQPDGVAATDLLQALLSLNEVIYVD
jgi:mono/diheme cytochrome c family protein